MMLRIEEPHVRLTCRDSSVWFIPHTERKSFLQEWTDGKPFWYGTDIWGATIIIKLADITGCIIKTAENIALHTAEADDAKARALVDGAP